MKYIKSLDGLRFLAVTLVLIDHWSGDALGFPASYLGVCMFFVLSGFLISGILFKAKEKNSNTKSLKRFFVRRTIRIFPLYYLVIGILFFLNVPPVRDKIAWLATYSSNIFIAKNSQWLGTVDHLWSLAVEEQFYLFFPFLILYCSYKNITKYLSLMVVIAVTMRLALYFSGSSWIAPYVLMPTCLDAFGLGGLLAYAYYFKKDKMLSILTNKTYFISSAIAYFIVAISSSQLLEPHGLLSTGFLRLFESLFSVFLIASLLPLKENSRSYISLFENSIAVYIGKISYGIYILHNFVYNHYHSPKDGIINRLFNKLDATGNIVLESQALKIMILYAIVIAIASLSWFLFEKPINKLKDRFKYDI